MKYRLKPQTAILVAGVLAATYAQACYYQGTSVVCFKSGDVVDVISWPDPTGSYESPSYIYAASDWYVHSVPGHTYVAVGPGYSSYTPDYSEPNPQYCTGSATLVDFTGHNNSIATWQNGAADGGNIQIQNVFSGTVVAGSTCD